MPFLLGLHLLYLILCLSLSNPASEKGPNLMRALDMNEVGSLASSVYGWQWQGMTWQWLLLWGLYHNIHGILESEAS